MTDSFKVRNAKKTDIRIPRRLVSSGGGFLKERMLPYMMIST